MHYAIMMVFADTSTAILTCSMFPLQVISWTERGIPKPAW